MDAKKVAEICYRAMLKGERSVVAGIANKLTVLSLKWMPRRLMATTAKFLMSRGDEVTSGNAILIFSWKIKKMALYP